MKAKFSRERFLALTNDEGKIVAIIQVDSGEQDINAKVIRAISEDTNAEVVELKGDALTIILDDYNYEYSFNTSLIIDEEEQEDTFTLQFVTLY